MNMRSVALALLLLAANTANAQVVPLWPGTAPGSQGKTGEEHVRISSQGDHVVSGVHRPTITVYLPKAPSEKVTAVLVIPGGGHSELWMDHEGYRVGAWLSAHGVAAFVLKYRLAREKGSTYTVEGTGLGDVQRAIRLIRSRAAEWHVAPGRIGVIGFSAGGELAALAGTRAADGRPDATDPVERESAHPAFMALMYPAIPRDMNPADDTIPTFLMCGEEDQPGISEGVAKLYLALKAAGTPVELHVLGGVGHGFGIRDTNPPEVALWTTIFYDWLMARMGHEQVEAP